MEPWLLEYTEQINQSNNTAQLGHGVTASQSSFPSLGHTTLGCEQKRLTYRSFGSKWEWVHMPGLGV